ncbi:2-C-methyl-D-erythritol 4-phosphate cytidylyltransferase [Occultella kanbiaonis]|uniref:2-C-methyl-D-erythritol 4-phosphate cytidylyltransferase n=1 Tax=Occultella kanbiaonis TaxID=2675754 RepID=UPI0013D63752|nr:2-C-methyl-D-erythritol 4-phosphate cytidylyltransferase [Occultella kanbiaonis]
MSVGAVLAAAGSGSRLGHTVPKALVPLGGEALVARAARGLADSGLVRRIVVTAPAGYLDQVRAAVAPVSSVDIEVVDGGATRQASVASGLRALGESDLVILVHDAARPLVSADLIGRLVAAVRAGHPAVVPGVPVVDTIRAVDDGDPPRAIATPDRSELRAIQTPQAFDADVLRRAHAHGAARADSEAVAAGDDAGLVEALGIAVHVVPGEARALKITTRHDLSVAALYLEEDG